MKFVCAYPTLSTTMQFKPAFPVAPKPEKFALFPFLTFKEVKLFVLTSNRSKTMFKETSKLVSKLLSKYAFTNAVFFERSKLVSAFPNRSISMRLVFLLTSSAES